MPRKMPDTKEGKKVTMEVYNHLGDRARIENEIAKLDSMAVNFDTRKEKIGVKPKKNDNFKSGKCLQTIDFTGVAKNLKN